MYQRKDRFMYDNILCKELGQILGTCNVSFSYLNFS